MGLWNSTQWRVEVQQALGNGSISHSGTSGSRTFTVDESAICSRVKESKQACISSCNKTQILLNMAGWKDLLSSVSLFGLAMLQLLDHWSREIWRYCTVKLTLNHQTRWLVISYRQCGHLCGWLCSHCIVLCGFCRIWKFVVDLKHLAGPWINYTFTLYKEVSFCQIFAKINLLVM